MNIQIAFPDQQAPFYIAGGVAALVLLGLLLWRLERRRGSRLFAFVEAALAPRLLLGYDARLRRPLLWLVVAGAALLLLALAQPRFGDALVEVEQRRRDILVLLDTSESMNAQDLGAPRLQRAKLKIESLLERAPADRFGLIAFSGGAQLKCPLTPDHRYFRTVLDAVNTDTLSQEGTDIAAALREARQLFEDERGREGAAQRGERAVLLVSDGEQVSGDALEAAQAVRDYAPVFVLGIGHPDGAEVRYPEWMRQYVRVPDDKLTHISRLDEDKLSRVALATGGAYVRVEPNNDDVSHLVGEFDNLAARAYASELRYRQLNRYQWPLALAIVLFMAEGLWLTVLPHWRKRRIAGDAPASTREDVQHA